MDGDDTLAALSRSILEDNDVEEDLARVRQVLEKERELIAEREKQDRTELCAVNANEQQRVQVNQGWKKPPTARANHKEQQSYDTLGGDEEPQSRSAQRAAQELITDHDKQKQRRRYTLEQLRSIGDSVCREPSSGGDRNKRKLVEDQSTESQRSRRRIDLFKDEHGVLRTSDVVLTGVDADAGFEQLMIPETLLAALKSCGFTKPSPVQLKAIPIGRLGVDLIAQAKSGTGKTVVFCVMALEYAMSRVQDARVDGPAVMILAPTREIALQITDVARKIASQLPDHNVKVGSFIGGTNVHKNREMLRTGIDVAIGTPGRIQALMRDNSIKVSSIRLVVLDEADKLLDGTFSGVVPWIVRHLPEQKQISTFSATFPRALLESLRQVMRTPQYISMNEQQPSSDEHRDVILAGIRKVKIQVPDSASLQHRTRVACKVLCSVAFRQCIVFSNDKLRSRSICNTMVDAGFNAAFTSGAESQSSRSDVIEKLREEKINVLVATDLISRGVDLPNCDMVIMLDVPKNIEAYLHRVGRAGRYGTVGIAYTIASAVELYNLEILLGEPLDTVEGFTLESAEKSSTDDADKLCDKEAKQDKKKLGETPGLQGEAEAVHEQTLQQDVVKMPSEHETTQNAGTDCTAGTMGEVLDEPDSTCGTGDKEKAGTVAHFGRDQMEGQTYYWEAYVAAYRLGKQAALDALLRGEIVLPEALLSKYQPNDT